MVERDQLDITAVPLIEVATQYLRLLDGVPAGDATALADFIAITARLMLLKSRSLLPRSATADDPVELGDPGADLAQALTEYRVFRDLAAHLHERPATIGRLFSRAAPAPPAIDPPLKQVPLGDLVAALQRALARFPEPEPFVQLPAELVTVEVMVNRIRIGLQRGGIVAFLRLVDACRSRLEVIVCFIGVLHLIRDGEIEAEQPQPFGEITLRAAAPAEC
jgi:segregation and condensation protein A